jgi:threonine/homoserine/homoserine lactone efflux protein
VTNAESYTLLAHGGEAVAQGRAFSGPKVSHGNAKMISFRDAIAGVLIGAVEHDAWPLVFVSCVIWAILSWLFVSTVATKAEYKSAPRLSFVSPTVSRIIV